jgi:hypothetical protein
MRVATRVERDESRGDLWTGSPKLRVSRGQRGGLDVIQPSQLPGNVHAQPDRRACDRQDQ